MPLLNVKGQLVGEKPHKKQTGAYIHEIHPRNALSWTLFLIYCTFAILLLQSKLELESS